MNEFLEKEQALNLASKARKEPVNVIVDCEVVESKRAMGYKASPTNCLVFIDGRFAIGEWLIGDE